MSTNTIIRFYGIPNCDTVKKARAWLTAHDLAYEFHDFKKLGVPAARVPAWLTAVGRDTLINRQGTAWRKLDAATQALAQDDAAVQTLLQAHPSVIKRPLVEWTDGRITVGFKPEVWEATVGA